jgi:hypothetical protein
MCLRRKGISFGRREEWRDFERRNPIFLSGFPHLERLLTATFIREFRTRNQAEGIVFQLANLCREDFLEILLLAGNGYGVAALRLLRGMYERAVDSRYLAQHPEKAEDFVNFGAINNHKVVEALKRIGARPEDILPEGIISEAAEMHARYKAETKSEARWNGLDLVSTAMQVGSLGNMLVLAHIVPSQQIHTTLQAIVARVETSEEVLAFDGGPQRERADEALQLAHLILLSVVDHQRTFFGLEDRLEPMLQEAMRDFARAWPHAKSTSPV